MEGLCGDVRIILKWILRKLYERTCTGLIRLRIATNYDKSIINSGLDKRRGTS